MRIKSTEVTAKTFDRIITETNFLEVWSDKGTLFKGAFKNLGESQGILTPQTVKRSRHLQSTIVDFWRTLIANIWKTIGHIAT